MNKAPFRSGIEMSPLRGWICFWIRFYKDVAPMALRLRQRELIGVERLPAWRRKEPIEIVQETRLSAR